MITLKEFQRLQEEVDSAKRERDRAQGSLDRLMQELQTAYGCSTLEEAERLQAKLQKEAERDDKKYQALRTSFEKTWRHRLDDVSSRARGRT